MRLPKEALYGFMYHVVCGFYGFYVLYIVKLINVRNSIYFKTLFVRML